MAVFKVGAHDMYIYNYQIAIKTYCGNIIYILLIIKNVPSY